MKELIVVLVKYAVVMILHKIIFKAQLPPCSRVLLEKLIATQLLFKFPKGSLPCSKEPATGS
jgi:antibiotic biosynthesis monooxygenase (ABM) superfamily enzyme